MTPVTGKMGRMNVPDIHKQRLETLSNREAPCPPRLPLSELQLSELPERLFPLR